MSVWNTIKVKITYFREFFKFCHLIKSLQIFSKPTHHVWLVTSKNKISASHSEKNFQKLDVYVKHHKSENTLFSTIFKIMSLDIIFTNFFKASTSCMIGHK